MLWGYGCMHIPTPNHWSKTGDGWVAGGADDPLGKQRSAGWDWLAEGM